MPRPLIGITANVDDDRVSLARNYDTAIREAGGTPVLLPPPRGASLGGTQRGLPSEIARAVAAEWLTRLDGVVMTGGADPIMEAFGGVTHEKASTMHPDRQASELALLEALDALASTPLLGICLGMQLMALHAGGAMDQHLPDAWPTASDHQNDKTHLVEGDVGRGVVTSQHRQAVIASGRLVVVGRSHDGLIEAISDPSRPFYLGVQWHPERTPSGSLGPELFRRLVIACSRSSGATQ